MTSHEGADYTSDNPQTFGEFIGDIKVPDEAYEAMLRAIAGMPEGTVIGIGRFASDKYFNNCHPREISEIVSVRARNRPITDVVEPLVENGQRFTSVFVITQPVPPLLFE